MIAMIYMELKDDTNALTYCEMADKINPKIIITSDYCLTYM